VLLHPALESLEDVIHMLRAVPQERRCHTDRIGACEQQSENVEM